MSKAQRPAPQIVSQSLDETTRLWVPTCTTTYSNLLAIFASPLQSSHVESSADSSLVPDAWDVRYKTSHELMT